jgi:phospholipase C
MLLHGYLARQRSLLSQSVACVVIAALAGGPVMASERDDGGGARTATPIRHVIILIGENRSFDNVFGTYQPRHGQTVLNLLSSGIVNSAGMPQLNTQSQQYSINTPYPSQYFIDYHATAGKTLYSILPQPNTAYAPQAPGPLSQGQGPFDTSVPNSELPTIEPSFEKSDLQLLRTGGTGLPQYSEDTRVANASALINSVFPLSGASLPYDSYTGDTVHRLFHMWQQSDCNVANATPDNPSGCLNDLYPFVGVARNDGSGGNSMGFYNVNSGDAPILKSNRQEHPTSLSRD